MQRLTDVGVFHHHVCAALRALSASPLKPGETRLVPSPLGPDQPALLVEQTREGFDWYVQWAPLEGN